MDETVSTPGVKNDKKREATSPPIPDDNVTEKKTRHVPGDGATAQLHVYDGDTHDVGQVESMLQDETDESTVVHMLTQRLNLNDIVRIATELRSLMLPEVKSAVKDAVKEATAPLQTQINDLKTENSNLKTKVDELEKKVATNEANIDSLDSTAAGILYEYLVFLKMPLNRLTPKCSILLVTSMSICSATTLIAHTEWGSHLRRKHVTLLSSSADIMHGVCYTRCVKTFDTLKIGTPYL